MRLAIACISGYFLIVGGCACLTQPKVIYRPAPETGTITRWIDGDTCIVSVDSGDGLTWEERVRLYNVWAPELKDEGGEEARSEMIEAWPLGASIQLEYPERSRGRVVYRDAFGRLLATIHPVEGAGR